MAPNVACTLKPCLMVLSCKHLLLDKQQDEECMTVAHTESHIHKNDSAHIFVLSAPTMAFVNVAKLASAIIITLWERALLDNDQRLRCRHISS